MSLTGNAESNYNLRGHISALDKIHGYSAYEIAVIHGYEGTEEEWLASLHGKDGYGAIVNDLTTGGTSAALSAEMGKVLNTKKANANLLHNWYFGNPVNQRKGYLVKPGANVYSDAALTQFVGTTSKYSKVHSITSSYATYYSTELRYVSLDSIVEGYEQGLSIDRWILNGISLSIVEGGIKLAATSRINQNMEVLQGKNLVGQTLTVSILLNGQIVSGTFKLTDAMPYTTIVSAASNPFGWRIAVTGYTSTSGLNVQVYNEKGNSDDLLTAVKLELGATQTLAHQDSSGKWVLNEIPDYGEELAKCQRYQVVYSAINTGMYWSGVAQSSTQLLVCIPLPQSLRSTPVPTLDTSAFVLRNGATNYSITGVGYYTSTANAVTLRIDSTGLSVGESYVLRGTAASKLILDANV